MRLIDADAQHDYAMEVYGGSEIVEFIDAMPTVDAVPVVHGHWINDKGLYRCSNCKHLWSELWWTKIVPLERMLKIMPYCPKCGAKMDGGINNAID